MPDERVLLVEDDDTIASNLARALTAQGYRVARAGTGASALEQVAAERFDLVLLDLGLPDIDGLDVCHRLTADDRTLPVIVLTARQEEIDVVLGLDAGAVDYVTKPFRLAELLARLRAQLRRLEPPTGTSPLTVGPLRLDLGARRVSWHGAPLDLRSRELDLLARLARDAGRVVSREDLMSDVWDEHWFGSTKTLDVHVAALRRKLTTGGHGDPIETLRGVGYRFEVS